MLRDPDIRLQLLLHLLLTLAAFIGCLFLHIPAAFLLLCCSLLLLGMSLCFHAKRLKSITHLCDQVDEILHGAEHVAFSEFREGELSILASEIHKMTVRLREQNAELAHEQQFMKEAMEDISHQLRTPLTSTMLIVGMMRDPALSHKERTEYLHELYGLLTRMQWLIETMLTISRLEAGAVRFQMTHVPCRTLIASAMEPLSIAMELKDIRTDMIIEGEPSFHGDQQYCTEALTNLLKNCMEHTPEGGSISIKASENSIYTEILVTDSGNGIAEQDLPHIFERFYRASEFARNGYGIGLSFARNVIAAQNGSLQVRNAVPHGAQFEIRFYKTTV